MKQVPSWWARQTAQGQDLRFQEPWVERGTKRFLVGWIVAPLWQSTSLCRLCGRNRRAQQRSARIHNGRPQENEDVSTDASKEI